MELLGLLGVFGRHLLFKSSSSLSLELIEFSFFENTRDFLAIDLGVFGVGGAAAWLLSIFFELLFETDLKEFVKMTRSLLCLQQLDNFLE
jgi:hypothetical protein